MYSTGIFSQRSNESDTSTISLGQHKNWDMLEELQDFSPLVRDFTFFARA